MFINNIYYNLKPYLPRRFQITIRRQISRKKEKRYKDIWPIHPEAGDPPEGWTGWPEGKTFALVLMHDVDTAHGQEKVLRLMELEKEAGFRSCFNFVPEGYHCSTELQGLLKNNGFGIGVHGLTHEGHLFKNQKKFLKAVPKINYYLEKWSTSIYSSPSMLGNLDWISLLNIECDCSTFDTDPFEPQANDLETIFPLIIVNSTQNRSYVELPYTMPQDHCLFIILQIKDNSIWKKKVDWIAEKGGMVLLNTHPDYMHFPGQKRSLETYDSKHYRDFLQYVKETYKDQYWHVLPQEMARFWREKMSHHKFVLSARYKNFALSHIKKTIWIDLDNTPHVPFFIPTKKELKRHGYRVILTARDAYQVKELAKKNNLFFKVIGRHYGKSKIRKLIGWLYRSIQMIPFVIRSKPDVALSHGSRSQIFICNLFKIPTILIADYEHSRPAPFSHPRWLIVPEVLKPAKLPSRKILTYKGLKEDVYVPFLKPDPSILKNLGIDDKGIIITVRPPAIEAHYHNPESENLFYRFVDWVIDNSIARIIILPRNKNQELQIRKKKPFWFQDRRVIIPPQVVDGLNLLYYSDLVVSGGGTMNREAASLNIPVYSIFRGPIGLIDKQLEKEGRLILIKSVDDFPRIRIEKRKYTALSEIKERPALNQIVSHIEYIIKQELERNYK